MVEQEKVTLASILRDISFGDDSTYGSVYNLPGRSNTTLQMAVRGLDVPKDAQDKAAKLISQNILLGNAEQLLEVIDSNSVAKASMLKDPDNLSDFYLGKYKQKVSLVSANYGTWCGIGLRDIGRLVLKLKPDIKWAAREIFHDAADIHLANSERYSLQHEQKAMLQQVIPSIDRLLERYARLQSIGGPMEQVEYYDGLIAFLDQVDKLDVHDTTAVNSNDILQAIVNNVYAAACSLKRNPIKSVDPFAQNDFFREDMERIVRLRTSLFGHDVNYVINKSEHLSKKNKEYRLQYDGFKSIYLKDKSDTSQPYANDMLFLWAFGFLNKFENMREAVFNVLKDQDSTLKNIQMQFLRSYVDEFKKRYKEHMSKTEFEFDVNKVNVKYTKEQFRQSTAVKIAINTVEMIDLYLSSYEKPDQLSSNAGLEQAHDMLLSDVVAGLEFLCSEEKEWEEHMHDSYVSFLRPEFKSFETKYAILKERISDVADINGIKKHIDPILTSIRQLAVGEYEFERYHQLYGSTDDKPELSYLFLAFCLERKFQLWSDNSRIPGFLDHSKRMYVKLMKHAEGLAKDISENFQDETKQYLEEFLIKGIAQSVDVATSANPELKEFIDLYHRPRPAPQ